MPFGVLAPTIVQRTCATAISGARNLIGAQTLFDEVIAVCQRAGFSPRIVNEPDFMATVLTLVESGLCVSIVPRCVASLKRPVLIRSIIPKSARIPLCVTWRKSDPSPVLMAFLKILRELKPAIRKQMEEHPWEEIRPIRLPNKSQPVKPLN